MRRFLKIRSVLSLLVCVLAVSFLAGCGSDPKDVAQDAMKAVIDNDFDSFEKVAYEKGNRLAFSMLGMNFTTAIVNGHKDARNFNSLSFGDAIVNGDEAYVPMTFTFDGTKTRILLKKVNGDWKFVGFVD